MVAFYASSFFEEKHFLKDNEGSKHNEQVHETCD